MPIPALTEELKLLDLAQCDTVGRIVSAMSRCSFGARMLGEVTLTLAEWIRQGDKPLIVHDGPADTAVAASLEAMCRKGWFERVETPESFCARSGDVRRALVIDTFSQRLVPDIFTGAQEAIYINDAGLAPPGQVQEGYLRNVLFTDPRYAVPLIMTALAELVDGEARSTSEFIGGLEIYGGVARETALAAQTLYEMVDDNSCRVFMTISGAMVIAKMGLIICDMIDRGMVQAVCTTGALMAHGLIESVGLHHYKYHPEINDEVLAQQRLNRVTDTLEPESNFDHIAAIMEEVIQSHDGSRALSPRLLNRMIGQYLCSKYPGERGILKSACEKDVPVIVPAFHDSELGNDLFVTNRQRIKAGGRRIVLDQEIDTEYLLDLAAGSERLGIFTVGGGVPRNYIQNLASLMELVDERIGGGSTHRQFHYGCRICPDPAYYGHLSGCTYSEGMSWRKMEPRGRFAEVHADATLVWPFLVKYVMERQDGEH